MHLAGVQIYPLKSAAGIAVSRWPLDEAGLRFDRHFMLVDPQGDFVTLRGAPRLVTIHPALGSPADPAATHVHLQGAAETTLEVAFHVADSERITVQIWGEHLEARAVSQEADAWCSAQLQQPVRLVAFDPQVRRQVAPAFALPGDATQFADGFPLLIMTTASLAALAERLGHAVEMDRFRPNLVVETEQPFVEDDWKKIRAGAIEIDLVKPCARCVGINVEPRTGRTSKEPLATLARMRTFEGKVLFGQNAIPRGVGELAVGDPVVVLVAEQR